MISIAIVIRTLNEGEYLESVIQSILQQKVENFNFYIVVVDSGSTDNTLEIAKRYNAIIINISREDFTYGYALNIGLEYAKSFTNIGVSLSGHCIPKNKYWLKNLVKPIISKKALLTFGSHVGGKKVRTSEYNYFKYKYAALCEGYTSYNNFNNGNSAFLISIWEEFRFNEKLIAQEDIFFAEKIEKEKGDKVFYSSRAMVVHIHDDTNKRLFRRLYNEFYVEYNLNVRKKSNILFEIFNILNYVKLDLKKAIMRKKLKKAFPGIIKFRVVQMSALIGALLFSNIKN